MQDKKEKNKDQEFDRLVWSIPKCFVLDVGLTAGKRRMRNFEGGNGPNNPCQPTNPNFNPNLPRCFNRGPS